MSEATELPARPRHRRIQLSVLSGHRLSPAGGLLQLPASGSSLLQERCSERPASAPATTQLHLQISTIQRDTLATSLGAITAQ
ncbi:hypothetical protein ACP70R_021691 [Stipagrostis hirtigluma subsp. patula]